MIQWIVSVVFWLVIGSTIVIQLFLWFRIKRFLTDNGEETAWPIWSWAMLNDYVAAANLAHRLGTRPKCLDDFVRVLKWQITLVVVWIVTCAWIYK